MASCESYFSVRLLQTHMHTNTEQHHGMGGVLMIPLHAILPYKWLWSLGILCLYEFCVYL